MADTNLKNALRRAGITPEEFAEVVRVDPKTVQRWVAGTTTPYPRHRATIARALDLTEHDLWPDHAPPPAPGSDSTGRAPAAGSQVTGTWAYDTDEGAPDLIAFLSNTDGPIDLLENFRGIQLTPELTRALAEHAAAGRRIRVLTNRPIRRVQPLLGHEHVEIRFIEYLEHSLLRAGDAMLLALVMDYEADQPPPLLQLHRTTDGGLFDRLRDNLDTIAENAEGPITTPEQLDRYRTNADDENDQDDEDWTEPPEPSPGPAAEPSARALPAEDPALPDREAESQRRWPR
jgi:transcriptional regulator with XRE-family HTH domain